MTTRVHSGLPACYTTLGPFAGLFATGVPVLTYHKLGPRPPRVRLKGLYLDTSLFERQLSELQNAGFTAVPGGLPTGRDGNPSRQIALTFDDGFANVLQHALQPLARHKFCAVEFLVADLLGRSNKWEQQQGESRETLMDAAQVREWLAAGHLIGSHSLTHPFLTRVSLQEAREEIFASKRKLEDLFGQPIRHFCYPYGDWNPAVRDLVVEAGYETACTTEFGVNTSGVAPFELRRITARYRSLSFKSLLAGLSRARFR